MSVAVYLRIASDLRRAIRRREYRPGDRIPSRNDLAKRYGTSDGPPLRAVQILAAEGLIRPKPGAGWFVRDQSPKDEEHRPLAIPAGMTRVTETVTARPATAPEAARLGIAAGETVLVIERECWAGDDLASRETVLRAAEITALVYGSAVTPPQ